jgi:AraC-like DNA-binding protein
VEPSHLSEALQVLWERPYPLPFVSEPVSTNANLSQAVQGAFQSPLASLVVDSLILDLAEGLMAGERSGGRPAASQRVDVPAIERGRQFLDAERTRVVHSTELESITGLTRYDLERPLVEVVCEAEFADQAHFTRAFKSAFGLTPGRYRALRAHQISQGSRVGSRGIPGRTAT